MNKRVLPAIVLPLLVAIGLMSLPIRYSQEIQSSLAQKALLISRAISKTSNCKAALQEPVQKWLNYKSAAYMQVEQTACTLMPFSINTDALPTQYTVAQVLFRNPSRWNSSLWIGKGSADSPLIKKNSPVLCGDSVVGVIEYVGKRASCVRLITDSALSPAVRVARKANDRALAQGLQIVQEAADDDKLPFKSQDEKKAFLWMIHHILQEQKAEQEAEFLAKGILQGSGEPLWKAENALLKGTGFNYDFKDQHGPSRDLRTGEPVDPHHEYVPKAPTPIVQVGDLLVTSGMDGIFPEGLKVAKVHSIMPLTEGAFTYELYATPTATDILNLDFVTILPPQDFDPSALPTQIDLILDQLNN